MAITGELAPFGLGRLCLHCRCFYNQNKGVVQQRIQEHYQNVRLDHFNLVNLPPVFLPCPFSYKSFVCLSGVSQTITRVTATDKCPTTLPA